MVERAESIYAGMPTTGPAKATSIVPVTARSDRAIDRLADSARTADIQDTQPPA